LIPLPCHTKSFTKFVFQLSKICFQLFLSG